MTKSTMILISILAWAAVAYSQTAGSAQPADANPSAEDRIKALEERIIALEGQVQQLRNAQATQVAAEQPPTASSTAAATGQVQLVPAPVTPAEPVTAPGEQPTGQLPVYGGASAAAKALNPDISVIGDFIASAGRNPIRPTRSFEMHESEVALQAILDPYARADFFISFGEQGVNLEEGFVTFTALPAGIVAKVGKMRAAFGKVNTLHNHVLPWVDRPLVTDNLVGGEDGIDDAGFSISRILPAPNKIFLEATGQVFRGDSSDVFHAFNKSDVSAVVHLRGYRDVTESTNLDLGLSYARGHAADSNGIVGTLLPTENLRLTQLYGVAATLRWKPLRRAIYHSFIARSEFIWSQRQQFPVEQRGFGFYTSGDYQFARRWFVGARYDDSDRSRDARLTDHGGSLVLTYWPSEFSQIRGQFKRTKYAEGIYGNDFLMQFQFALGAHGAHPF